ncbi:GntR family transcriptional regulator [Romboutsia sedimentorum]|uniref:GntR family transcriptional regulator n=1 Tax=Romboutsia sedimentorum TaxID=1368474 RepID=A0ABT7E533_9FIRM|nr:GntR family transcriptional regulator [Romboutsia sedimentorum]MDK2562036.1 GntR family transcriptional regulator [Romboutsia sedimentorum]MDK2584275.1 GntR family transcriptional regulator [Romboutsia sedimentorum]
MYNWMDEFVNDTDLSQNRPIREVVYESLRSTLISGKVPVGERIIEKEYAQRLNISRTPVREALKQLETEDLIEYIPRLGVVAKKVTKEDVIEIYRIRESLEFLVICQAMENITPDEINKISELLDLTENFNMQGNINEVNKLFTEFNFLISDASRMRRLPMMISNLSNYLQRFRNISILDNERRERALVEHRQILNAIVSKDKDLVEETIKSHLEVSLNVVLNEIS